MSGTVAAITRRRWRSASIGRRELAVVLPLAILFGYLVSPYVAVARLAWSMETNDVHALGSEVNWSAVRAGIDRQIAALSGGGATSPAAADDDDQLPAFGQSFATTATDSAVASAISPSGLENAMLDVHPSGNLIAAVRDVLDGSVFIGADRFELRFSMDRGGRPAMVRIGFRFTVAHGWRVERLVLPQAMIDGQATAHT